MKTVAFHTLGCKVNQYETQSMMELFKERGYALKESTEEADVYVINTCTVTNVGDRKSRQFIRRMKGSNPNAIVAVVGCYAQMQPEEVKALKGVDLVIGTNGRREIVDYVENYQSHEKISFVGNIMNVEEFEELGLTEYEGKTRAFIKIQEGCNQYCTYCIIPYARGNIRSRNKEMIMEEVTRLAKKGYREVVITGIHVASYGKDFTDGSQELGLSGHPLLDLLMDINGIRGIERIRLSSLEPNLMTGEFVKKLKNIDKLCPHFHLSLQSGSDEILQRMNRKYSKEQYGRAIELLREAFDHPGITTDVIVGFPGESDEHFRETKEFIRILGFSELHVFKYSPKKGTPAAKYRNQVDGKTKQLRSEELITLGEALKKEYLKYFAGKVKEVLFESYNEQQQENTGFSREYGKVRVCTPVDLTNKKVRVKITEAKEGFLLGNVE